MSGPNVEGLPMTPQQRNYPLDPEQYAKHFTTGVWIDVVKVLSDHGYPELTGLDLVELQMALFDYLYARPKENS